jgi:glycosyltransferase involved in cell wall biosynthesis
MSEPLTVAQVVWRLSPSGGVQVVLRSLIQQLDPSKVQSHVISVRPAFDDDLLEELPAQVHPLDFQGNELRPMGRIRLSLAVAKAALSIRPDVVQLHSGTAWLGIVARLVAPRTAFLLEVHDAPGSGRHGKFNDRFEGWCMRRLGMTPVCHSAQVADALVDRSCVDAARIHMFPLGIDTERFLPMDLQAKREWRKRHGFDPAATLVVAVGRPAPSKRFDMTIEAAAHGRSLGANLQLLIVGVGASPELRSVAESCGISDHVVLWDARYGDAMATAIAASDVLSSTSSYEGFGLTLAEGMACGLPVVAMHVGGVGDLVDHDETGFLVPSGDTAAHGARLASLAGDHQLADRLGDAGRERAVRRFGVVAVAERFRELYLELACPK